MRRSSFCCDESCCRWVTERLCFRSRSVEPGARHRAQLPRSRFLPSGETRYPEVAAVARQRLHHCCSKEPPPPQLPSPPRPSPRLRCRSPPALPPPQPSPPSSLGGLACCERALRQTRLATSGSLRASPCARETSARGRQARTE